MPARWRATRSAFSIMWWRLSAGSCLEGNEAVSLYIGPQAWVLDRFGENFDGTTERLSDAALKSNQPNEIHLGRRVELDHEVHVAVRHRRARRSRTAIGGGCQRGAAPPPALARWRSRARRVRSWSLRSSLLL